MDMPPQLKNSGDKIVPHSNLLGVLMESCIITNPMYESCRQLKCNIQHSAFKKAL